jgi:hypothetical protein
MNQIRRERDEIASDLAGQDFELPNEASLVPIYAHRYLVCAPNLDTSAVLSIVVQSVDAIVYGNSLREFLEREFLAG